MLRSSLGPVSVPAPVGGWGWLRVFGNYFGSSAQAPIRFFAKLTRFDSQTTTAATTATITSCLMDIREILLRIHEKDLGKITGARTRSVHAHPGQIVHGFLAHYTGFPARAKVTRECRALQEWDCFANGNPCYDPARARAGRGQDTPRTLGVFCLARIPRAVFLVVIFAGVFVDGRRGQVRRQVRLAIIRP